MILMIRLKRLLLEKGKLLSATGGFGLRHAKMFLLEIKSSHEKVNQIFPPKNIDLPFT